MGNVLDQRDGSERELGAARCAAAPGGRGAEHRPIGADASAARAAVAGRREAPGLDLSLGHFGTSDDVHELDLVSFGPWTVALDYGAMTLEVEFDPLVPSSRQTRRADRRKVDRLIAEACRSGMRLVQPESPALLDAISEDEQ